MTLKGQIALVTGASSGIGKAIALALRVQGARVCVVGRDLETLRAAKAAKRYVADFLRDEEVRSVAEKVRKEFGALDILVHSAGLHRIGGMERAHADEFALQFQVNTKAPYVLTQALIPLLRARRGQVVFVNSSVGCTAKAHVSQYAATKHALKAIADGLREEVNADGVRVLSVFAGRTATPMQKEISKHEGRVYRPERLLQPEDIAAVVVNTLLLPGTAEVTEIHIRPMIKSG